MIARRVAARGRAVTCARCRQIRCHFEVVKNYEQGMPLIKIGVVNRQMPFMLGAVVKLTPIWS